MNFIYKMFGILVLVFITSCASIKHELTKESYQSEISSKGVVILSINWGRKWGCGQFENAEIINIGFDKLPLKNFTNKASIFLDGPSSLFKDPVYEDYALLVETGKYVLSQFKIKAARSTTDIGYFNANKSQLIVNGNVESGVFDVNAGEVVYIGHFYLDCYQNPIIWRFHKKDRESFNSYIKNVKLKYPFLNEKKVHFRLFKTKTMGYDFELLDKN